RLTVYLSLLVASLAGAAGCGEKAVDITEVPSGKHEEAVTDVIYEANPRLFGQGAAFGNIAENLDRIGKLGTTVLWLMPIYPEGSLKSVGSPYCVKDYCSTDSRYGTLDDFKSLVSEAHTKGMRVILDWVANHTAWDHEWITSHPEWYTQDASGNIISPAGTGWNDVADLNYGNAGMRAEMIESMKWWMTTTGIDGFRCDAADYVPADFWKEAIEAVRKVNPDALMLAESSNTALYEAGFDLLYGWSFNAKLSSVFSGKTSLSSLYEIAKKELEGSDKGHGVMRYTTNHDLSMSEGSPVKVFNSAKGALVAFVTAAFSGGVPMIYSSQETGYESSLNFFKFVDIDWDSDPGYTDEYLKVMKAWSESASCRKGNPVFYNVSNAATIWYEGGLLVMVNVTSEEISAKIPMERAGDKAVDLTDGSALVLPAAVNLGAYEYKIWKTE
ncbi:MAG: alpha-amylase family glycosyl hydrolase, partial [Candidatus Cryptobacteroides sp.]